MRIATMFAIPFTGCNVFGANYGTRAKFWMISCEKARLMD
jgi:hypothetical protein